MNELAEVQTTYRWRKQKKTLNCTFYLVLTTLWRSRHSHQYNSQVKRIIMLFFCSAQHSLSLAHSKRHTAVFARKIVRGSHTHAAGIHKVKASHSYNNLYQYVLNDDSCKNTGCGAIDFGRNRTLCLLSDVRMYSWISLEMRALYTSNTHTHVHTHCRGGPRGSPRSTRLMKVPNREFLTGLETSQ